MKKCSVRSCGKVRKLTKHHIYPKRFFSNKSRFIFLCRECHDRLEKLIPYRYKLTQKHYCEIADDFVKGKRRSYGK